ncbi:unnamed protein product [Alopecurus aequalis]
MATQDGNSVGCHNPDMVGKSFTQHYYSVLCESTENVHLFYHDESIHGRPDSDGTFRSITTTRAIKKYYLSSDLKGSSVQLDNVVTQTTQEGGFFIVVVGTFIMPDTAKRGFYQSFVLAPQGIGNYFVASDILGYFPAEPETLTVKESTHPIKESMDLAIPFSDLHISVSSENFHQR